jgi:hypothetical protein
MLRPYSVGVATNVNILGNWIAVFVDEVLACCSDCDPAAWAIAVLGNVGVKARAGPIELTLWL